MHKQLIAAMSALVFTLPGVAQEKLTIESIIARHLESVGTAEARAAAQSRFVSGQSYFKEVITGKVQLNGTAQLLSQGRKTKCAMKFPVQQYTGEQFVFDGKSVQVAMTDPGQRSVLGNFLFTQQELLTDGVFGGTLFLGWPLFELQAHKPSLKYQGLKKIGDRELHEVTYIPRKRASTGELQIRLYFEPATFRHVMTTYHLLFYNQLGAGGSQMTDELRQTFEEKFSDFRTVDGLTLPTRWEIRFRKDRGTLQELQWELVLTDFRHNVL